jgi:3-deoxy-D-manno-octulosonic acid kinase
MREAESNRYGGGIVYDAERLSKPAHELFSREYWRKLGVARELQGGRGGVLFVTQGSQRWVLRHYKRGGFAARFLTDSYLWTGKARCRSYREWRLLATLKSKGLPVPAPVAAQYTRRGIFYSADLLTEEIPNVGTLASVMAQALLERRDWQAIGATIALFHRHGVHHADLNAHNIMIGESGVHILDFDRGSIQQRGAWERRVLERLHRSLRKVWSEDSRVDFGDEQWEWLMEGYGGGKK